VGNKLTVILLFLAISGCKKEDKGHDLTGQRFIHLLTATEQQCQVLFTTYGVNCFQEISFTSRHEVNIMLTDIVWKGTYWFGDNMLHLQFGPNLMSQRGKIDMEFLNPNMLKGLDRTWKRYKGPTTWDLYD
jgi:hypothetical protein